ncbi:MAG: peptidoglycan-binding protein [Pedococcus sp.]
MTTTDDGRDVHTNSLGESETEPVQTDNGPKEGDGEVLDQDAVVLPGAGEHEGAGLLGAVLAEALRHRGTIENPVGSNRQPFGEQYGWNGVAWCNIFVSRVGFGVAGEYDLLGKFASTIACARWWDGQGRFGREPRPGAAVFFDWRGSRSIDAIDHIGLVIEPLGNGLVRTIEGNAAIPGRSDGVWVHERSTRFVVGYGYPSYSGAVPARAAAATTASATTAAASKAAVAHGRGRAGTASRGAARAAVGRPPAYPGLLKRGSTGNGVLTLQRRLRERGWKLDADGEFGSVTDRVVRGFQTDKRLAVDGEVGPRTWSALWSTPVT